MIEQLMLQIQINNWKIKVLMITIELCRSIEPEYINSKIGTGSKHLNFNEIAVIIIEKYRQN